MLRYDGKHFNNLLDVTDIRWNILPPQDVNDMDILGRPGAVFLDKKDGPREIEVDVIIRADSIYTYEEKIAEVAKHLRKKEPKELIFDQYDRWKVNAIVKGSTELDTVVKHGTGTITFYCPDPAFYLVADDIWNLDASTGTTSWQKTRDGNDEAMPLIKITGSGGGIKIDINGTAIKYTGALSSGETLYIDSRYLTAYIKNGAGNKKSAMDDINPLTFPTTQPGSNNITLTETGGADVETIEIENRSRNM